MNAPIRVMIVDDSSVVRRMLSAALSQHREVEIVGSAANGVIALSKLSQLTPEALILDVEMPEMDGITMLSALREKYPRLPVIMFSTLTERGANVTFDALGAGASDYVLKPSTQNGETLDSVVANILVPKLVALTRSRLGMALSAAIASAEASPAPSPAASAGSARFAAAAKPGLGAFAAKGALPGSNPFAKTSQPTAAGKYTLAQAAVTLPNRAQLGPSKPATPEPPSASSPARGALSPSPLTQPRKSVQLIVIAASTGGPNALAEVLPRIPGALTVPVVVVQHMPPIFTRCLADRLSSRSELKILESAGDERLLPGHVYIAPGNRHLEVVRDAEGVKTHLSEAPPENSCRPAADVLMRSAVRCYGGNVLVVVLTGMGQDGLRGAREIRDAGGRVLVQSGPTCVIWGMPKAVEEAGLAEAVVPLPDMALAILQRVGSGLLPLRSPEAVR